MSEKGGKAVITRIGYAGLVLLTVIIGLLSRSTPKIPLFIGDILWATMVFFIVRFLFVHKSTITVLIISLIFCYAIEFFQLYQVPWITRIRHTIIGHLVLGETFNWGDLLSYTAGIAIGIGCEWMIKRRTSKT